VSLDGVALAYSFPEHGNVALDALRERFHDFPAAVGYEFEGELLPGDTKVFDCPLDPERPITVILREMRVSVQVEQEEISIEIESDTTARNILEMMQPRFAKSKVLSLFLQDREVVSNRTLVEANPDLRRPFVVRAFERTFCRQDLQRFVFHINGAPFEQLLPAHLATVDTVKRPLMNLKKLQGAATPKDVGIYVNDDLLSEDDPLIEDYPYTVKCGKFQYYDVRLIARGFDRAKCRFKRVIQFAAEPGARLRDFVEHVKRSTGLPASQEIGVELSEKPLPPDTALAGLADKTLHFVFQGPSAFPEYLLCERFRNETRSIRNLKMPATETVHDLKVTAAGIRGRTLPEAIQLCFWSVDLVDNESLVSYGLPDGSRFDYSVRNSLTIDVLYNSNVTTYTLSDRNRIIDLRMGLAKDLKLDLSGFFLEAAGSECPDSEFIVDMKSPQLNLRERPRQFVFRLRRGEITVELQRMATVGEALSVVAARCDFSVDDLSLRDSHGETAEAAVRLIDLVAPITLQTPPKISSVTFQFKGNATVIELDCEKPLADLLPIIRERLQIAADAAMDVLFQNAALRPTEVLADTGGTEFEVRVEEPAVAARSVRVGIATEAVPRIACFTFPAGTTVGEALTIVCEKYRVSGDVQFVLEQRSTEQREYPPPTTLIDSLDLDCYDVLIAAAKPPVVEVVTTPASRGLDQAEPPEDMMVLSTVGSRPAKPEANTMEYTFACDQRNETFAVGFERGKTVKDARIAIATRYDMDFEFVTLVYGGKPLRDTFILDRLRIGKQKISVYLKGQSEVVLMTAAAMYS
jgi:hypothetical protein